MAVFYLALVLVTGNTRDRAADFGCGGPHCGEVGIDGEERLWPPPGPDAAGGRRVPETLMLTKAAAYDAGRQDSPRAGRAAENYVGRPLLHHAAADWSTPGRRTH